MKYQHVCPKCESTAIVRVPGNSSAYGTGMIFTKRLALGAVRITQYVSTNCGFVEGWVDQPEDLEKIRQRYQD